MNWLYAVVDEEDAHFSAHDKLLTEYGEEGWELVTVVKFASFTRFYFKKPNNNNEED